MIFTSYPKDLVSKNDAFSILYIFLVSRVDHIGGTKRSVERGADTPFKYDDGQTPLIKGIIFNLILNLN